MNREEWEARKAGNKLLKKRLQGVQIKPELLKPGFKFKSLDGTEYIIDNNGSRRRI